MTEIDSPSIEDFKPVRATRVLGVDHLNMVSSAGVRLVLTEEGINTLRSEPDLSDQIAHMGVFIAKHGGYKDSVAVTQANELGVNSLLTADPRPYGSGMRRRRSSIYRLAAAPGVIVKAYDYEASIAGPQFYLASWMVGQMAQRSETITLPKPLALFTAANGHRTTLSENIAGISLFHTASILGKKFDANGVDAACADFYSRTTAALKEVVGRHADALLGHPNYNQLILEGVPVMTLDDLRESRRVVVTGQPDISLRTRYLYGQLRIASLPNDFLIGPRHPSHHAPSAPPARVVGGKLT